MRDEKVKVLRAVRPIAPEDVARHTVRGQYKGYRDAEGVAPDSDTPTFVALRYYIDNWRWQGVPFYLRSGKALQSKSTEITIFFRRPPHLLFPRPDGSQIPPNSLSICIQPDEGIQFSFQAKVPDTVSKMQSVDMSFEYDEAFGDQSIPEAYERLLLDVLKGDASLFTRSDSIELAWALVDPILEGWSLPTAPPLAFYEPGTWGPEEADTLIRHDGYGWTMGCGEEN
jgi:glucose-6-phosphate 1-dehydrogenase